MIQKLSRSVSELVWNTNPCRLHQVSYYISKLATTFRTMLWRGFSRAMYFYIWYKNMQIIRSTTGPPKRFNKRNSYQLFNCYNQIWLQLTKEIVLLGITYYCIILRRMNIPDWSQGSIWIGTGCLHWYLAWSLGRRPHYGGYQLVDFSCDQVNYDLHVRDRTSKGTLDKTIGGWL